jgi:hypothetical protein
VEVIRPVRCHTERGESLSYCGQGEEQQSRSSSGSSQYHLPSRIWREPARLRLRGLAELREGWHRGAFWQLLACCWRLAAACVFVCVSVGRPAAAWPKPKPTHHPHRRYAGRCLLSAVCCQGISPQFPGVLVGPPRVRKCYQMSSKEHIQLGWVPGSSVGSLVLSLSTPPGHPAARRSVRAVCRASTSLAPLYSPCASSAFGWGSTPNAQLPLRASASSRGVLPGAGALECGNRRLPSSNP